MNALVQQIIVFALVVSAALFVIWRLAGAAAQLRWLQALSLRISAAGYVGKLLRKHLAKRQAATGCGACSTTSRTQK